MQSKSAKLLWASLVLGTTLAHSDLLVEDFKDWVGANKAGGLWLADGDVYGGGTSTMVEPTTSQDIVKNSANILMTWDETVPAIIANITVSASVKDKDWAYAGWVMDFKPNAGDTVGGIKPWDIPQWDRKNQVDISGCTGLQITMQFTANKQMWIELYNPMQEKNKPLAPQYGWRFYEPSGNMVTKTFNLVGLGGPVTKWTDPVNTVPKDFSKVNRIKILYEGQVGGAVAVPPPYDALVHTIKIAGVKLIGGPTCVVPGFNVTAGIVPKTTEKSRVTFSHLSGSLVFNQFEKTENLTVKVRDLTGATRAYGLVNKNSPALDVSALKNGVYTVEMIGSGISHTSSITLLK